jgi:hypothetical protein
MRWNYMSQQDSDQKSLGADRKQEAGSLFGSGL